MNDLSLPCVFVNFGCTIGSHMSISTKQKKVVGGFGRESDWDGHESRPA